MRRDRVVHVPRYSLMAARAARFLREHIANPYVGDAISPLSLCLARETAYQAINVWLNTSICWPREEPWKRVGRCDPLFGRQILLSPSLRYEIAAPHVQIVLRWHYARSHGHLPAVTKEEVLAALAKIEELALVSWHAAEQLLSDSAPEHFPWLDFDHDELDRNEI